MPHLLIIIKDIIVIAWKLSDLWNTIICPFFPHLLSGTWQAQAAEKAGLAGHIAWNPNYQIPCFYTGNLGIDVLYLAISQKQYWTTSSQ